MEYRIVLTKNKKSRKILYRCRSNENAINKFRELIKNNKVLFPQKFINYRKIIPVKYELLLIKERDENDKNRIVRNDAGKLVEETTNNPKWVIIDKAPYNIEETFWVFGHHQLKDRFDIKRIIKEILLKDIRKKNYTLQIVIVNNKLIFQGQDDFDIVFCKCKQDAIRLHNALMKTAITTRMDKLLFLGCASDKVMGELYIKIQEKTGWNMKHVRRPSTRH